MSVDVQRTVAPVQRAEGAGLQAVISTNDLDRDGRVVEQDGWVLDNYAKNPVVLWNHNWDSPPLGTAKPTLVDGKLVAQIEWADTPEAQTVAALYEQNVMSSFSPAWLPIEFAEEKNDDDGYLTRFTKQELLEISAVPLPSNPNATVIMAASLKGVGLTAESPQPVPDPPAAEATPGSSDGGEPPSLGADAGGGVASPGSSPDPVSAPSPESPDEALADEVRQLMNRTPAPEPVAVEVPDGEGSAPLEASGLQTRHEHAKRVAEVTAQVTERVLQRLTGRLPD